MTTLALLGFVAVWPLVGQVLTGLIIGRGSNALNDLLSVVTKLRAGQP